MLKGKYVVGSILIVTAVMFTAGAHAADAPSIPTVQYTYHAFGFAISTSMGIVALGREGRAHVDQSGRIVASLVGVPTSSDSHVIYDSPYDDRNVAGGITPTGAIILFFGRFDVSTDRWIDMGYIRSTDSGRTWSTYTLLPTEGDSIFSPYGPLVVLPSGRLLQTTYGTNLRTHSIRVYASDDDGMNWRFFSNVTTTRLETPTEASALFVGGTNNSNAHILVIARTASPGYLAGGLTQYESIDGGRTWIRRGRVFRSVHVGDVAPWMVRRADGTIVLVWTDRTDCMCIRQADGNLQRVWRHPERWPSSTNIYTSRLATKNPRSRAHFGYASIVSNEAVFYDITAYDNGDGGDHDTVNTEFIAQPLAP
ncbi:MAG: sialidase family protein [Actinomycetota bacterium]